MDQFFSTSGQNSWRQVIGIISSGTGSDGATDWRVIKAAGGVIFAQALTLPLVLRHVCAKMSQSYRLVCRLF
ncbi:MAG: chemotaxis protein CheB [Pseudomonadota bacterium]